jgi:hypothetical protein
MNCRSGLEQSEDGILHSQPRDKVVYNTRMGVAELLNSFRAEQHELLLEERYAHDVIAETNASYHVREWEKAELNRIRSEVDRRTAAVIKSDGKIADYLKFSQFEIRQLATRLAEWECLSRLEKVEFAETILGTPVPGSSIKSQYKRTCSASYWRRTLAMRVSRARELFFLRLGMIGKKNERYSSNLSVEARKQQLYAQEKWMRATVLVRQNYDATKTGPEERYEVQLSEIAKRPEQKIAKLYTFLKGMDSLGIQQNLVSAMVSITLEPEWHPNPLNRGGRWNGKSPREAHKSFCKRWQAIMRDLDRIGVKLSGLRVVEPHGDACPHYHIWLLHRPEHESKILLALMRYFPLKLKIRSPNGSESSNNDIIYDDRKNLAARISRPSLGKKDGVQVEFSRIVRELDGDKKNRLCKGASYVMKYLVKTLPADIREVKNADKPMRSENNSSDEAAVNRVDAFRTVWGINQGQLFGVAKCLTIWDELRRIQKTPTHPLLKDLWIKARGGTEEGRVEKCAGQHGDAHSFLEALGGLDAARTGKRKGKYLVVGRLVENARNRYGDVIKKTIGIRLLEKERRKVRKLNGEEWSRQLAWKTCTEVILSIKTKVDVWKFERRKSDVEQLGRRINTRDVAGSS